jgi:hypothetical protein
MSVPLRFTNPLLGFDSPPSCCPFGDFVLKWRRGRDSIRTRMTQLLFVGLIHQDWSAGAEVVHPFKLGDAIIREK